jgi:hypothetical protein
MLRDARHLTDEAWIAPIIENVQRGVPRFAGHDMK